MSEEEQVTQQDPKQQKKQEEQDASKKALKKTQPVNDSINVISHLPFLRKETPLS